MQTVELDATISAQDTIALPPGLEAFRGCRVHLTLVLDDKPPSPEQTGRAERQAAMRQALAAIAQAGTFADIDDASAWQREARAERAQPGREN